MPSQHHISTVTRASTATRRVAEQSGRIAEHEVAAFFQAQGFQVLAERLRTGAGELDLVVADDRHLVFVEVKARRCLLEAAYAVSPRAQARLLGAASLVLATRPEWQRENTRFDVAFVTPAGLTHLPDAIRYN